MCTELLPPGGYPIAVKIYHIISYQTMQSDAEKPEHPSEVIAKNRPKNKQPLKSHVFYTVHCKTDSDGSQFTVIYLLD